MTSQLGVYNGALLFLGERQLATLNENRPPRRYLDAAWNGTDSNDSALGVLLAAGQWKFAQRSVQMNNDANLATLWGYPYAFAAPSDFVRTTRLCVDEFFQMPLEQYEEEDGVFYAFVQRFYLSYVSNHSSFGGNLAKWPPNFSEYAQLYLALKILPSLTGNKTATKELEDRVGKALTRAQSTDAMEAPTRFPARGTWARARTRGRVGGWDGGSITRLIG